MIRVFDFFSGCGGTSLGFQNLGFDIIGALDSDEDSAHTFQHNFPNAKFLKKDIRQVAAQDLSEVLVSSKNSPLLFCGCAPCQPFSNQRRMVSDKDNRKTLLSEFQRFIEYWKPDFIFLENVPGLQKITKSDGVFSDFTLKLTELGYDFDTAVVQASHLGVPQIRKRFILIAATNEYTISPISSIVNQREKLFPTTRDYIYDLPPIDAGEQHTEIANHAAAKLSPENLIRIKHTPEGGDRRDWPAYLKSGCHKKYKGHTDVYGRMRWDAPASTLTTRCISYSNGRFGHPEQDRAISVREAARLQTFPDSFIFTGSVTSCARQVGNAVPPLMAQKISECFIQK
jgi:DNA (cytosine-5)-methyltransferase 1